MFIPKFESEEIKSEVKTFQAMSRSELVSKQGSISAKLCYHLIRLIEYPDYKEYNHWITEIVTWMYDTYTGAKIKSGAKPYLKLISDITLGNEDYDSLRINDIIDTLRETYGIGKYSESQVEEKLDSLFNLYQNNKTYTKQESKSIFLDWYNEL